LFLILLPTLIGKTFGRAYFFVAMNSLTAIAGRDLDIAPTTDSQTGR
jgi:hypothetical protein